MVGADVAGRRAHDRAGVVEKRERRRLLMDCRAEQGRGARQPERKAVGVEMTAAAVVHAAEETLRAERGDGLVAIEKPHLIVAEALGERGDERRGFGKKRGLVQRLDDARPQIAGNGEADDQRAHERLRLLRHVPEFLGAGEAELLFQPEHVAAEAGVDLPAVAAGGAACNRLGLNKHDVGAGLGEMDRGGEPGEAAADDADIGPARAVERRIAGNVARGEPEEGRRENARHRDQTLRSRYSRSHALITPMKVSYSVSLMAR